MHVMQTNVINDPWRLSCGFMQLCCAVMAKQIDVLLRDSGGSKEHCVTWESHGFDKALAITNTLAFC